VSPSNQHYHPRRQDLEKSLRFIAMAWIPHTKRPRTNHLLQRRASAWRLPVRKIGRRRIQKIRRSPARNSPESRWHTMFNEVRSRPNPPTASLAAPRSRNPLKTLSGRLRRIFPIRMDICGNRVGGFCIREDGIAGDYVSPHSITRSEMSELSVIRSAQDLYQGGLIPAWRSDFTVSAS